MRSSSSARFRAACRFIPRWISRTSAIWWPTSQTGFSDDCGCWKIMLIRSPRMLAHLVCRAASAGPGRRTATSPASIRPGLATSRMIDRLVTLLPQPDSPTRPMISPRSTWKSMPSTARTTPSRVWNDVRRPLTSSSGRSPRSCLGRRFDAGTISSMMLPVDGRDRAACRSWPSARRPRGRPRSSVQPRVEGVAQAVAEQVETEDREGDRDARCQDDVRRVEQLVPLAARSSSPTPGW